MPIQRRRTLLAVDDDEICLMLLAKCAKDAGCVVKTYTSCEEAWQFLQDGQSTVDIVITDKMMPGMTGLELLTRIKSTMQLQHIPVIIQTGDTEITQMQTGIEAGSYYYLTKPYHPELLLAIIQSASQECMVRERLVFETIAEHSRLFELLRCADFEFKTHSEARALASALSHISAEPDHVSVGLYELFCNAIEHGNLEIGHELKRICLNSNGWQQEISHRLTLDKYADRKVCVAIRRERDRMLIVIRDQGSGFDWMGFFRKENPCLQANEPNGCGIARALVMLENVSYNDTGSVVSCEVPIMAGSAKTSRRLHKLTEY